MSEDELYPRRDLLLYLSGKMSAEQSGMLEQRMLEDGRFSAAIEAAEFSLLDDFAAGLLSPQERQQAAAWIERSPSRNLHVRIAQQLHRGKTRSGSASLPRRVRVLAWGLVLAALLVCVLLLTRQPQHPALSIHRAAPSLSASAAAPAHQDTILLIAERLRGTDSRQQGAAFDVQSNDAIRLQVLLPASATDKLYMIALHGDKRTEGHDLQFSSIEPTQADGSRFVELLLPPGSLSEGTEEVLISSQQTTYWVRFKLHIRS